jgi:hypothetical protein
MIDYIVKSKKPYPDWLKGHKVFQELPKIDKVFPRFGLANFREPCEIMNLGEASAEATRLGQRMLYLIDGAAAYLRPALEASLQEHGRERNEKCFKIQSLISLCERMATSIRYNDYIKQEEGKVALRLRNDLFWLDATPFFRKNEGLISVLGKLYEELAPFVKMTALDQYEEFKSFSKTNIANKKYHVVFSSTGEEGAWDTATISMRGITSCQAWSSGNSRGLIGTMSSKFAGVIYITSDQMVEPYGTKMLYRAIVRFVIDKATKKPALLMDTIYPNHTPEVIKALKKALHDRSKLDVHFSRDGGSYNNFYIPDEPSRTFLTGGEFPYMDYAIAVLPHASVIKKPAANITSLTTAFKTNVGNDIAQLIVARRALYNQSFGQYKILRAEYDAAKSKWAAENADKPENERTKFDGVRPALDPEISFFGKNGSMTNLLEHCDKKHGANSAGRVFATMILDSFDVPDAITCETKEEYHRRYLMTFLKNSNAVKEKALAKIKTGTWMKQFPKSADRLFEFVFGQMRGYVIAGCKEIIKKAN